MSLCREQLEYFSDKRKYDKFIVWIVWNKGFESVNTSHNVLSSVSIQIVTSYMHNEIKHLHICS